MQLLYVVQYEPGLVASSYDLESLEEKTMISADAFGFGMAFAINNLNAKCRYIMGSHRV